MGLMDFIKKQFIDILQWTERQRRRAGLALSDGGLRDPVRRLLTVRESQIAVFVNEGKIADVFGPGMYKLTTQTLPVLTYLKNWDKLFQSPFKSDVYFFSTRLQVGRVGHAAADHHPRQGFRHGAHARLRHVPYKITDAKKFYTEISGTRDTYTVDELEGQLRSLMLQHIATRSRAAASPFLDMAANQGELAER